MACKQLKDCRFFTAPAEKWPMTKLYIVWPHPANKMPKWMQTLYQLNKYAKHSPNAFKKQYKGVWISKTVPATLPEFVAEITHEQAGVILESLGVVTVPTLEEQEQAVVKHSMPLITLTAKAWTTKNKDGF